MNRPIVASSALVIFALGLAGCGGESRTLASVGKSTITVGDYLSGAKGAAAQYPFAPDSAKSVFLDDLVRRRLLLEEARNRGLFDDSLTVIYRRTKEQELLGRQLSGELVPAEVPVSEAEVRRLYDERKTSARVQLIYAFSREVAQSALEQIRRGEDFGVVADRLNPTGMLPARGDIGEQLPGNLVSPLDDYIRTAPPGTIAGPLDSPTQGWFVLKILDRQPHAEGPYETEKAQLIGMLHQRKQRAVAIAAYKRLREGYRVRLEPGGAQALFHHFNRSPGESTAVVSPAENSQVLARWETPEGARTYTFGDALLDLQNVQDQKPDGTNVPSIEQWVLLQVTRRVQTVEATRRGFELDPGWRRELDESVNNYVLDALYANAIGSEAAAAGPEDAHLAYIRNQQRFEQVDRVTLETLEFPDSAAVQRFLQHAGHHHGGGDLRAIAAAAPGTPPVRDVEITFPSNDPDWERLAPTFRTMGRGDAIGPFVAHGHLVVAMLMDKSTSITPFDKLAPADRAQLDAEASEFARERRFLALLDELKRRYPVTKNQALLKQLPWPVEPTAS